VGFFTRLFDQLFPQPLSDAKEKCDLLPKGFHLLRLRCIKNADHSGEHKDRNGFTWDPEPGEKKH
jgi:hypothetical protein